MEKKTEVGKNLMKKWNKTKQKDMEEKKKQINRLQKILDKTKKNKKIAD